MMTSDPVTSQTFDQPASIAGINNPQIARRLIKDMEGCLLAFGQEDGDAQAETFAAAIEMVKALTPADPLEAQLIVQLVCTHNIATNALQHAHRAGQDEEDCNRHYKRAGKFLSLFQDQIRTLLKYRAAPSYRPASVPRHLTVSFVHPNLTPDGKRFLSKPEGMIESGRAENRLTDPLRDDIRKGESDAP